VVNLKVDYLRLLYPNNNFSYFNYQLPIIDHNLEEWFQLFKLSSEQTNTLLGLKVGTYSKSIKCNLILFSPLRTGQYLIIHNMFLKL